MAEIVPVTVASGWNDDEMEYRENSWYTKPGTMIPVQSKSEDPFRRYLVACPGCGKVSSPVDGASWRVTVGIISEPTTLTVTPSYEHRKANGGCGWHGHLKSGKFVPCS